jgi:hypothetical protein
MAGRKPGPTCASETDTIDDGTSCLQKTPRPGPQGIDTEPPRSHTLSFEKLWDGYPGSKPYVDAKTGDPPKGFENQCALKVSVALHAAGVDMRTFDGAHVLLKGRRAAVRAEQLAAWLGRARIAGVAPARDIAGEHWQDRVKGKTGILFFADYWLREGEKHPSGDHIDLWNGSRLTASGLEGTLVTVLRFGLGVNSGPGFSDLGKAKKILFWEIR